MSDDHAPFRQDEIDAADELVREQFPRTRLWHVASWPGVSALADWSADATKAQVDHLGEDGAPAVSVRTDHGLDWVRALRRMHGQSLLHRGTTTYRQSPVGDPAAASEIRILVDGESIEARLWEESESWWLVATVDDEISLLMRGDADRSPSTDLFAVTDVEPLLAARRDQSSRRGDPS
ncbi:hypothetical protein [Nesterenkonia suensis]